MMQNQSRLECLAEAAQSLFSLGQEDLSDENRFHDVVAAMHRVCVSIAEAERRGCEPAAIREAAAHAHAAHQLSPFVHRLQTWPRGYPGDFETIEHLLHQQVLAPVGTLGFWIETYVLGTLIAQQHRNKIAAQAEEIQRLLEVGKPARILMIAANSGSDLARVSHQLQRSDCHVVLNDNDPDALAFCLDRLSAVRHRLEVVAGNPVRSLPRLARHGPFDLVLAGGLFDYLPERLAELQLRGAWQRLLAPGGRFFFSNLGRRNPYRVWMEYLADWHVIERSDADLRRLIAAACGPTARCDVRTEATGLTWLVSVAKPALP
jgi:extracellular factor (EF) 3-hydroxypalmitic acid methyl ester biosynthesis protein